MLVRYSEGTRRELSPSSRRITCSLTLRVVIKANQGPSRAIKANQGESRAIEGNHLLGDLEARHKESRGGGGRELALQLAQLRLLVLPELLLESELDQHGAHPVAMRRVPASGVQML